MANKKLNIADGLALPLEAVTQTFGIMAKRGSGKTYTASVMTEEMLKAGLHVVVIDPIGVWYGLRSSADGEKDGLPIIIAGGEHADIPITPESGELLAELIIDNRLSMVIDVSLFRKAGQTKFMTDFAETIYRKNRNALHLMVDEADAFAPQKPQPGQQRMLGAMEDLVRRGRAKGIGMTMITQRPAVLNKNVLTQIEVLVALRLTAPNDQRAIDEWVKSNAEAGQREEFMGAISSLPIGDAYFWSPGWLKIFKRVHIRQRETLDSSSTPIAGKEVIRPKKMASIDIEALKEQLAETSQQVESNDPKVLKREISELKKLLADSKPQVVEKIVKIPTFSTKQMDILHENIPAVIGVLQEIYDATAEEATKPLTRGGVVSPGAELVGNTDYVIPFKDGDNSGFVRRFNAAVEQDVKETNESLLDTFMKIGSEDSRYGHLSNYANNLLDVFRKRWPMQVTRYQLAVLSKRSQRSSAFTASIKELQQAGYIGKDGARLELTSKGQQILGLEYGAQESPEATIAMWRGLLPPYERDLLSAIMNQPDGITKEELSIMTGRSITSSGFSAAISNLVKCELVTYNSGVVKMKDKYLIREAK